MNEDAPRIDSRRSFAQALQWGLQASIERGTRTLLLADADFSFWPLDDAALRQALGAWVRLPGRRLQLLAQRYEEVPRRSPRFTAWRRDWAHAVDAWQSPEEMGDVVPTLLLDDGPVSVHLMDAVHWRGRAAIDVAQAQMWREKLDALLQRCERSFSAYTLGL